MLYSEFRSRRHFEGLNGIRAIAIIAVIWHHSPHATDWAIEGRGFFGVDLFFVLSGFLISTLLIRERERTGKVSLGQFWMRRALRLAPAYYLLLALIGLAYVAVKHNSTILWGLPVYALYLSNFIKPGVPNLAPTWSLSTEEQFYLLWPWVEAFASPFVLGAIWWGALIANQLLNFGAFDAGLVSIGMPRGDYEIMQATFTPILLGVGLAHLLNDERSYNAIAKVVSGRALLFAGLLLALLCLPVADISGAPRLAMQLAATAFLASVVVRPVGVLEWWPLERIGLISYGMYLYHLFCLNAATALMNRLGAQWATFIVALGLTIAVSALSYLFLERWFLNLRERFRTSLRLRAA